MFHLHVTKCHHADGLPDSQTHTGSHTPVQSLDAVLVVDVLGGLAHGEVLGAVGVISLALHLDTDHLNGLVPGRETTTETGSQDLLKRVELLTLILVGDLANSGFSQARETEAGSPVGGLANGNGVDTTVDTTNALLAVDIHESREGAGGLDALGGHLVLGDLDGLHAGTETHGRVCLCDTTDHTSSDTGGEVGRTKHLGTELRLRCDEEEDGALSGGLNPGPRNETLII